MQGIFCRCGSILPLAPGEECQLCGEVAQDDCYHSLPPNPMTSSRSTALAPVAKPAKPKLPPGTYYYYQSQCTYKKDGTGVWKKCGPDGKDEQYAFQMARLDFKVKKIVVE